MPGPQTAGGGWGGWVRERCPAHAFSRINPCSQSQPEPLLAAADRLPWGQTVVTWMDLSGSDQPGGRMQAHYQLPSRSFLSAAFRTRDDFLVGFSHVGPSVH